MLTSKVTGLDFNFKSEEGLTKSSEIFALILADEWSRFFTGRYKANQSQSMLIEIYPFI